MLNVKEIPESLGYYFAGFVDGEGSFHISFRRRKDYKQPWKVSLCMNISQKDRTLLAYIKRHLKCGTIRYKSRDVWMYEVNNLTDICENVIPFFDRLDFLSAKKKRDFSIFKKMSRLMVKGAHLQKDGIVKILNLRRKMNDGGKRKYTEAEILSVFE
jgi:hypothetical protein